MPKPSDDLSALFRSLRPDEAPPHDNHGTTARDVAQRWPLFKAVVPEKPRDTVPLSAQERQRWVNQDMGGRKPALSLPGLSDKMSQGLDKMSVRAFNKTAVLKPVMRREPEVVHLEHAAKDSRGDKPAERLRGVGAGPTKAVDPLQNESATAARVLPAVPDTFANDVPRGLLNRKQLQPAPSQPLAERKRPEVAVGDSSLKSLFNRLEAKAEVVVKPASKPVSDRSSFMDRLGKR